MLQCILVASACTLPCRAAEIVFVVSTGSDMPMTAFSNERLTDGILKDFGDTLSRELRLTPRYLNLPRKRVETALDSGQADILCDMRPEWFQQKNWLWSQAIFSNTMIVASTADTPRLHALSELSDQQVGTVHGYVFPEVDQALGQHFLRDNGPSDIHNLNKLLHKRYPYLITNSLFFEYQLKFHPARQYLNRSYLTFLEFDTYCALPANGRLTLRQINRAIEAIKARGEIRAILNRYRIAQL